LQAKAVRLFTMNNLEKHKKTFGITSFRSPQDLIIKSILNKNKTLALLPTGYGKSICYQLPSLLLPKYTLVISPLIALMDDQVFHLREKNISAIALHSNQNVNYQTFLELFNNQHYKFIYISPERLLSNKYRNIFFKNSPSFIAIDEAHCFSLWGNDFRPEYRKLPEFINQIEPSPIISLFTATASKKVIKDLKNSFNIKNIFSGDFFRKNLFISNKNFNLRSQRFLYLCYLVFKKYRNQNGLIYCVTRKEVEIIFKSLKKIDFLNQLKIEFFHAKRSSKKKQKILNDFLKNKIKILVTTNAFGMGVDKGNINYVIHSQLPSCLENYVQEIGRAGRDRNLAFCELLTHDHDLKIHKNLNNKSINKMIYFSKSKKCHHQKILNFFDQQTDFNFNCESCNYCSPNSDIFIHKLKNIKNLSKSDTFIKQQKEILNFEKYPQFISQYNSVGTGFLEMC
jgi:ATP-dependent DNA helicase RecQ